MTINGTSTRPPKAAMLVAQRIMHDVFAGRKPGNLLLPERTMLEKYQTGRGTLREALRLLEFQGVIALKPGPRGGPVLQDPDASPPRQHPRAAHAAQGRAVPQHRRGPHRDGADDQPARRRADGRRVPRPTSAAPSTRCARTSTTRTRSSRPTSGSTTSSRGPRATPLFGYIVDSLLGIMDGTAIGIDYPSPAGSAILKAHDEIFQALQGPRPGRVRGSGCASTSTPTCGMRSASSPRCSTRSSAGSRADSPEPDGGSGGSAVWPEAPPRPGTPAAPRRGCARSSPGRCRPTSPRATTTTSSATSRPTSAFCSTMRMPMPESAIDRTWSSDRLDHRRGQAHRRLVEQHHLRLRHQRPAEREHLLLAAAEQPGRAVAPVLEDREHLEDLGPGLGVRARRRRVGAQPQVLLHRQRGEDAPPLGHQHDALAGRSCAAAGR